MLISWLKQSSLLIDDSINSYTLEAFGTVLTVHIVQLVLDTCHKCIRSVVESTTSNV